MLLMVSLAWGLGYCVPEQLRIPFAEVFPPAVQQWSFITMRGWGVMLLVCASTALLSEHLLLSGNRWAAQTLFLAHTLLAGIYSALAAGALYTGFAEQSHWAIPGMLSACSRPLLWSLIAWLHSTYARIPLPPQDRSGVPKPRTRLRLIARVPVDDE